MKYPSFDNIINDLNAGKLHSFPGGVHPDDKKTLSNTTAIAKCPLPKQLIVPVKQHVGTEGAICVSVGDYVQKGQALTHSNAAFAVPVHAPSSGHVVSIIPHVVAHPSGLTEMCIVIDTDGRDTWCELSPMMDYTTRDKTELLEVLCNAGISGMGGAGFPSHIKAAPSKPIEFLIINGVECEPYITSDDRLMREHAWQIRQGLDILSHIIEPQAIIIAVEDNKPEALQALTIACQDKPDYHVVSVETKYPAGGEKQLIQVITGREVPRSGLPSDIGVTMFNVGTCYAVADAVLHGKPLIDRIVTLTGEALKKPGNYQVLLGTPVNHLLGIAGYLADKQATPKIVMGGPMMGFTLADAAIPVVKTTNCLLVPSTHELRDDGAERACIRCSACSDACPANLLPQQLYWHAKAKEYDKTEEYDLFDCIECGACAYVCPSEIPLVHYYRQAKSEIRLQKDEKDKAEKAKLRFEARKERLQREKEEREEKHRKAKEARLAAKAAPSASNPSDSAEGQGSNTAKDKVAAALARAKAKKAALETGNQPQDTNEATSESVAVDDKKAKVAAAIARAKAKKAAAQESPSANADATESAAEDKPDDKKAKIAAAVARAKAKKAALAQATEQAAQGNSAQSQDSPNSDEDKKAKIAAAVARAKAKKAASEESARANDADNKQARIAAAIAKAKAKKAEQQASAGNESSDSKSEEDNSSANTTEPQDEKQARIAAAVAKAKARRNAVVEKSDVETTTSQPTESEVLDPAEEKKRRIAAAVAKAKAKKAAADKESQE